MSDLIRRSDAIKAVDAFLGTDPIVERIKRLPSADRPQGWIPCSERLPKEDGFYLATITDGEQIAVCKMPFVESEWRGDWFDDEVIAWMPLPEPWEGADDE